MSRLIPIEPHLKRIRDKLNEYHYQVGDLRNKEEELRPKFDLSKSFAPGPAVGLFEGALGGGGSGITSTIQKKRPTIGELEPYFHSWGISFYYIPLTSQKRQDCWYQAARKIIGFFNPHHTRVRREWEGLPSCSSDDYQNKRANNVLQVWDCNRGPRQDEDHILEQMGFKPLEQIRKNYDSWDLLNMAGLDGQVRSIEFNYTKSVIPELSINELDIFLKKNGPLWTHIQTKKGSAHALVLVGTGPDFVILNNTHHWEQGSFFWGSIDVVPIDYFNRILRRKDYKYPIWYYDDPRIGFEEV